MLPSSLSDSFLIPIELTILTISFFCPWREILYKNKYLFLNIFKCFFPFLFKWYRYNVCASPFSLNFTLEIILYQNTYSCSVLVSAEYTTVQMYPKHLKFLLWMDIKTYFLALTSVAQWVEHCPTKQKVTGSIPGQGTRLGCGFSPQSGCLW